MRALVFTSILMLLINKIGHVSHIDETSFKKCDKITGYNPETGIFEVYENVQTQYLPKIEDVDLLKAIKLIIIQL